jgi:hypothetical protein
MQLFTLNTQEDEAALLAYSDSQWPMNQLWVEGGNATSCNMVSNIKRTSFEKTTVPCVTTYNSFYCEYKSENNLQSFSKEISFQILTAPTPKLNEILQPVESELK